MQRLFNRKQKKALYLIAGGKCEGCGVVLKQGWHADHVAPWATGGETDVVNGQALCPKCNLRKGAKRMKKLRQWQERCLDDWGRKKQKDYLISATPGAGKTVMALNICKEAREEHGIDRFVFVVPSVQLKHQWRIDALQFGIQLDPDTEGVERADYHGVITTYQSVLSNYENHRARVSRTRTMVVFDEIHHAGDNGGWGKSVEYAFSPATIRLSLSGTPFRTDNSYIPFVRYERENGHDKSLADFSYGYADALKDGVVKTIDFFCVDGFAEWSDSYGQYGELLSQGTEVNRSHRLRTAFMAEGDWMRKTLHMANEKLNELREEIRSDTGGIIFVTSQHAAREFESNPEIHSILGEIPTVVYSDKEESQELIEKFKSGSSKWIVSVQQISEGIDIPRLSVMVLADSRQTDLLFRQRVGRIIRRQSNVMTENLTAYAYIPDDKLIRELAAKIESEIEHVIMEEETEEAPTDRRTGEMRLFDDYVGHGVSGVGLSTVILNGNEVAVDQVAEQISQETGLPIDKVIKIIMAYDKRKENTPAPAQISPIVQEDQYSMRQRLAKEEEKWAKKCAAILHKKDVDKPMPEVYKALWKVHGKHKKDCSNEELRVRIDTLKEWCRNDFIG